MHMKNKFFILNLLCLISIFTFSQCTGPEHLIVTFNSNGGGEIKSQVVNNGEKAVKPENPIRADYVLTGWFKDVELLKEWFFDFDIVTNDITLFAKWKSASTFNVTFNSLGGSPVEKKNVIEGQNVTKPEDPTRAGYIFGAWYKEPECSNKWNFENDVVTKNTTLFASWFIVDYDVTILPETYQTIKGWGVFPSSVSSSWSNKTAAHTAIYRELGITQFRIELRGQYGNGDGSLLTGPNGMDNYLVMLKVAKDNGIEKYSMHVWSPPPAMKSNNAISCYYPIEGFENLLKTSEQDFCNWMVNAIKYSEQNGYKTPIAVSFQNEPDVCKDYQSCGYGKDQYIRVAKLLRTTLNEAGYNNIVIIGPESGGYVSSFRWLGSNFESLDNDPEFANALGAFCSHSYAQTSNSCAWCTNDLHVQNYIKGCDKYPAKDRWQTEFCMATRPSSSQTQRAIDCFRIFASDMGYVRVNYWNWWIGHDIRYSLNADGQEVLLGGSGISSVTKNSFYYLFQKIFTNVLPGSKMQLMSTTDNTIINRAGVFNNMVAFKTEKGTVALFINTGVKNKTYRFLGLKGNSSKVYSANNDKDVLDELDVLNGSGSVVVTIPANSVNIIVSE